MTLKLNGSSSGHVNLDAKAAAASNTLTLPDTANGELVAKNSSGDLELSGKQTITHDDWDGLRIVNTNTNTYGAYIDLVKDSSSMADDDQAGVIRFRGDDDAGNEHTYGYILGKILDVSNGSEDGHIEFHTSYDGTIGERLRITRSGNIKVLDGDLQINTAGHGIDFSATSGSGTSELFSDYEEGTFTPTWAGGINVGTYHIQNGFYTKIGRYVYGHVYLYQSVSSTNGDSLQIGGLPFTSGGSTSVGYGGANTTYISSGMFSGISDGGDYPIWHCPHNNTLINCYNARGGAVSGNTTGFNPDGKEIIISFYYMTA